MIAVIFAIVAFVCVVCIVCVGGGSMVILGYLGIFALGAAAGIIFTVCKMLKWIEEFVDGEE